MAYVIELIQFAGLVIACSGAVAGFVFGVIAYRHWRIQQRRQSRRRKGNTNAKTD